MAQVRGWLGTGAAALLLAAPLGAQTLWLPAADPVGIGRGGAGIAFGQSLEAASLNPALLCTLRDPASAFLAGGMVLEAGAVAPLGPQVRSVLTSDRNRVLPALGAHWRLREGLVLGLKLDAPFERHGALPAVSRARFRGSSLDLSVRRIEFQGAWAPRPEWAFGVGLGTARIALDRSVNLRVPVGALAGGPVSTTNPSLGLAEAVVAEEGTRLAMSYALGFRWAPSTRWTLGGAYQGALKGTVASNGLTARLSSWVGNDGFSLPPQGLDALSGELQAAWRPTPGSGRVELPARASLGVRHRLSQIFTWEFDARYVFASGLKLGGMPGLSTPSGEVGAPKLLGPARGGLGFSALGEFRLTKQLVARVGASVDPSFQDETDAHPLVRGGKSAGFSGGFSYAALGGEISLGYQYRQMKDQDTTRLDQNWNVSGAAPSWNPSRVEGMGHLWSIGFKRVF